MKSLAVASSLGSGLPQVLQSLRARSAGELSLATCSLGLLGSSVRMYTVRCQLADDWKIKAEKLVSVCINCTVVLQILVYRRQSTGPRRSIG